MIELIEIHAQCDHSHGIAKCIDNQYDKQRFEDFIVMLN